jgi:protein SCO1/2
MNDRRTLLLLLTLTFGAPLLACTADPGPPPLQGARMGGPFQLTDQNGRRVSSEQFAGRYRIVYFGYTFCPDVCPVDLQLITAALRQFEASDAARAARVQPIFITTDPARDTPAVLRDFAADFHSRLIALTGTTEEIGRVARAYGVYFEARQREPGAEGYLVDHNRIAVLYGPEGQPIAILPHDRGPAGVLEALQRWVR